MKKKWITASQAAELACVTSETIRNLCKSGVLSYKKRHHLFFVNKDEVLKHTEEFSEIHEAFVSTEQYLREISEIKSKAYAELKELKERVKQERLEYGYTVNNVAALSYFAHRVLGVLSSDYSKEFSSAEIDIINNYLATGCVFDPNCIVTRTRAHQLYMRFFRRLVNVKNELEIKDSKIESLNRNISILCHRIDRQKQLINVLKMALKQGILKGDTDLDQGEDLKLLKIHNSLLERLVDCDFSVRVLNSLKAAELETVEDLIKCNPKDLLGTRNFGKKSLTEVNEFLEQRGLHLGMNEDEMIVYSLKQLTLEKL